MDAFLVLGQIPGTNYTLSFDNIISLWLGLILVWLLIHVLSASKQNQLEMRILAELDTKEELIMLPPAEASGALVYSQPEETIAKQLGSLGLTAQ